MKVIVTGLVISLLAAIFPVGTTHAAQVFNTDLVVKGSECLGVDCEDTPSFGYDALVFKENNLRIYFEDTSSTSSFPRNDWRITINDRVNGGKNKFAIDDVSSGRTPFTIEAGARVNSLFIDPQNATGNARIGIGTSSPAVTLHIADGNTPAVRLWQDGSDGWGTYTWDVAGNERNFFIRDVSSSSNVPFKIIPGAGTDSFCIYSNGNVGLGIKEAAASLHIKKTGLTASNNMILIQNGSLDTLKLDGNGNLTAAGTISHGSSRSIKKEIEEVRPEDILSSLMQLDIYTWQYKADDNITHLGPMSEDFSEAFSLGADKKHIAPGDVAGIALAAIKALNDQVEKKDLKIKSLEKQNADLSERLTQLENLVHSLAYAN